MTENFDDPCFLIADYCIFLRRYGGKLSDVLLLGLERFGGGRCIRRQARRRMAAGTPAQMAVCQPAAAAAVPLVGVQEERRRRFRQFWRKSAQMAVCPPAEAATVTVHLVGVQEEW